MPDKLNEHFKDRETFPNELHNIYEFESLVFMATRESISEAILSLPLIDINHWIQKLILSK